MQAPQACSSPTQQHLMSHMALLPLRSNQRNRAQMLRRQRDRQSLRRSGFSPMAQACSLSSLHMALHRQHSRLPPPRRPQQQLSLGRMLCHRCGPPAMLQITLRPAPAPHRSHSSSQLALRPPGGPRVLKDEHQGLLPQEPF